MELINKIPINTLSELLDKCVDILIREKFYSNHIEITLPNPLYNGFKVIMSEEMPKNGNEIDEISVLLFSFFKFEGKYYLEGLKSF